MKKLSFSCLAVVCCTANVATAQTAINSKEKVFKNEGSVMSVAEGGVVSTLYPFSNEVQGTVRNDGIVYYYDNFKNEGDYHYNKKTGTAVFSRYEGVKGSQLIEGSSSAFFTHVVLNNEAENIAFDLKNNMVVDGNVDFQDGIIKSDSLLGALTFRQGAGYLQVSDNSHAEGVVEKEGNEPFQYPKGDRGLYRYARISAPEGEKDQYDGQYHVEDHRFFKARSAKSGVIDLVDDNEYWTIEKSASSGKSDVILTLSWDERTTPAALLKDPEKELHIIRWDEREQMWVDEGGIVDVAAKEITTPTSVRGYGFFTLGTVKTDYLLDGDVVIYDLVTPNGDGKNDYFVIDNIDRFPNNTVEIYNRWGVKVYETKSYNTQGNVFRGYSDGRVTMSKNEKLPSGTYYYIVIYEYNGKAGARTVKKAGDLHLENN